MPSCQVSSSTTRQGQGTPVFSPRVTFRGLLRSAISMSPVQSHSKYSSHKNHAVFAVEAYGRHLMVLNGEEGGHFCLQFWMTRLYQRCTTSTTRNRFYATPYRVTACRQFIIIIIRNSIPNSRTSHMVFLNISLTNSHRNGVYNSSD